MATRQLQTDLATVIVGRHAKIASAYTGGATDVIYTGNEVSATCRGRINMPASMRDPSNLPRETELLSWAFLNHEMGHEETDRQLEAARQRGELVQSSPELVQLVPAAVRPYAVKTGAPILRYAEFLERQRTVFGDVFVRTYGADRSAATSQVATLVNVYEDPRMEATVVARWRGTERHLRHGFEHVLVEWRKRAEVLLAHKLDGGFGLFAIALCFQAHGQDVAFMGPRVAAQLDIVSDIVEVFRARADWQTFQGFNDSVNAALATLARVYECVDGTFDKKPQEANESLGGGESSGGESSSPKSATRLEPGMLVEVKATGGRARIVQVFADGSIEAEPVEDE